MTHRGDEFVLLRKYAATRSQPAFAALVERYVDLVYAAARRQLRGNAHLAEDVTQAVFIVLAEKAGTIPADRPLSAWLLRTTSYCAANARRAEMHRQSHERRAAEMAPSPSTDTRGADTAAWEELSPLLDEGLEKLRGKDRDALLLRFFEKKSLREVGESMGISEEAAGKRVSRAVDRLRDFFRRRGAVVSAAALTAMLTTQSTQAAPVALVTAVTSGAATATTGSVTGATAAGSVAKGTIAIMAVEKAKVAAIATAVVLMALAGGAVVTYSMGISSKPRPVRVATPAAPMTPRGAASPAPTFPAQFSDGTVIELVAISAGSPQGPWWSAHGLPTAPPPVPPDMDLSFTSVPPVRNALPVRFVLRMTGTSSAQHGLTVQPGHTTGGSATTTRRDGDVLWTNYVTNVPQSAGGQTTLQLAIAHGPWREDFSVVVRQDASAQPAEAVQPIRVIQVSPHGNDGAQVVLTRQRTQSADRLEGLWAVLRDGTEVPRASMQLQSGRETHTFRCRSDEIERLVSKSRALEWLIYRNVALERRAQPTSIEVIRPAKAERPTTGTAPSTGTPRPPG